MPTKAPVPCSWPSCPEVIPSGQGGRCAQHKRPSRLAHTQGSTARGYDSAYQRARTVLLRDYPVCSICRMQPSTQAHHVAKVKDNGPNTALVALCSRCHGKLTARGL